MKKAKQRVHLADSDSIELSQSLLGAQDPFCELRCGSFINIHMEKVKEHFLLRRNVSKIAISRSL